MRGTCVGSFFHCSGDLVMVYSKHVNVICCFHPMNKEGWWTLLLVDLRNPGHSGITCCHCDIAWCCLLTWSTTKYYSKNICILGMVFPCSFFMAVSHGPLVLRTSAISNAIWMCLWEICKGGWQSVCVFLSALSFQSRTSWVFSLQISFSFPSFSFVRF